MSGLADTMYKPKECIITIELPPFDITCCLIALLFFNGTVFHS